MLNVVTMAACILKVVNLTTNEAPLACYLRLEGITGRSNFFKATVKNCHIDSSSSMAIYSWFFLNIK